MTILSALGVLIQVILSSFLGEMFREFFQQVGLILSHE